MQDFATTTNKNYNLANDIISELLNSNNPNVQNFAFKNIISEDLFWLDRKLLQMPKNLNTLLQNKEIQNVLINSSKAFLANPFYLDLITKAYPYLDNTTKEQVFSKILSSWYLNNNLNTQVFDPFITQAYNSNSANEKKFAFEFLLKKNRPSANFDKTYEVWNNLEYGDKNAGLIQLKELSFEEGYYLRGWFKEILPRITGNKSSLTNLENLIVDQIQNPKSNKSFVAAIDRFDILSGENKAKLKPRLIQLSLEGEKKFNGVDFSMSKYYASRELSRLHLTDDELSAIIKNQKNLPPSALIERMLAYKNQLSGKPKSLNAVAELVFDLDKDIAKAALTCLKENAMRTDKETLLPFLKKYVQEHPYLSWDPTIAKSDFGPTAQSTLEKLTDKLGINYEQDLKPFEGPRKITTKKVMQKALRSCENFFKDII
jgi:hypothetical protein